MTTVNATLLSAGFPGNMVGSFEQAINQGMADFSEELSAVFAGDIVITSQSASRVDFTVGGRAGFMTGHFGGFSVVIERFFVALPGGGSMGFRGDVFADAFGSVGGSITSMFLDSRSIDFDFAGNLAFSLSGPSGSLSRLDFSVGDFDFSMRGDLSMGLGGDVAGTLTFVRFAGRGNSFQVSGISEDVNALDAFLDTRPDAQEVLDYFGYAGDDKVTLDFAFGATFDGQGGNDTVAGGRGADSLLGGPGDDNLAGGGGNDTLEGGDGADTLSGGAGNDAFVYAAGDSIADSGGSGDEIRSLLAVALADFPSIEHLMLLDGGANTALGTAIGNRLTGNSSANLLSGEGGDDTLIGGAGSDTTQGGAGDDTHVVDSAGDLAQESDGGGIDTLESAVDWTLAANFENLRLTGAAVFGSGNELGNLIAGNALDNVLDGRGGSDTLVGGAGNDTYILGPGDSFVDSAGNDTALSDGSFFSAPANIENVTLSAAAGSAWVAGSAAGNQFTGNGGGNLMDGGGGADTLVGGRGDDTLIGGAGNDIIDGGRGADVMEGGAGNDVYVVSSARDRVVELAGAGRDTVEVEAARYALAANVENAVIVRAGGSTVSGNALANTLTGGPGADRFVFDAPGKVDLILGFTPGVDRIVIEAAVFGTDITYEASTGALFYGAVQLAQLGDGAIHPALAAADIQIV